MADPDLEALAADEAFHRPAAREFALWLVALTAPACVLLRPAYAAQAAYRALTRRKRWPRG